MINEKIAKKKAMCEALEDIFEHINERKNYLSNYINEKKAELKELKECYETAHTQDWKIEMCEKNIQEIMYTQDALKLIEAALEKLL